MRTLYVGDVHGCAAELSLLLERAAADRVVLVGDLFTKGPDPLGVWRLVREVDAECVLGNHDDFVLRRWSKRSPPEVVRALRELAPEIKPWLEGLPLMIREEGRIVIHAGVHPLDGPDGTSREQATRMRRWPDDKNLDNPFWYDAGWAGPEVVIFGHDAARGLVRREREGRLVALGLDTGCVYGGKLTGWIAEEDQLLQIPAARVYRPVR